MNCFALVKVLLQIPPVFYLLNRLSNGFIELKLRRKNLPLNTNYSISNSGIGRYFPLNVHSKQ
jgi:hypothetical protein